MREAQAGGWRWRLATSSATGPARPARHRGSAVAGSLALDVVGGATLAALLVTLAVAEPDPEAGCLGESRPRPHFAVGEALFPH